MTANQHAILTLAEMAQADQMAIQDGTHETQLITAAGQGLAEQILALAGLEDRIVVCCGGGNNGADGYACAAQLVRAERPVRILSLVPPAQLKPAAQRIARTALNQIAPADHLQLRAKTDGKTLRQFLRGARVLVDALFGTGLNRPPQGISQEVIRAMNRSKAFTVAADLPSGINGDTAQALSEDHIHADLTVTFFRPKLAHYLYPGAAYCGRVVCIPIGIKDAVLTTIKPRHSVNGRHLYAAHLKRPNYQSHKYNRGHALVFAGERFPGAGILACMAAQRAGAGLVSAALSLENALAIQPRLPASCILRVYDTSLMLAEQVMVACRGNAALIGPASGVKGPTHRQALSLLAYPAPVVLDADALTVFSAQPEYLFKATRKNGKAVLTPHEGEFKRLFRAIQGGNKAERAQKAATISKAVVVLKGGDTVIATPPRTKNGGHVFIARAPSSYLATGGSGDVLSGIIVSLLAQGLDPVTAACAGVDMHNRCAQIAGVNLIAEDLIAALPQVATEIDSRPIAQNDKIRPSRF